jgi:hypothetical protein
MKQTAVEWFEDQVGHSCLMALKEFNEIFEKAKEMEKEVIIESYCQGCFDISKDENIFPRETSEQYYNETFNKSINNKG